MRPLFYETLGFYVNRQFLSGDECKIILNSIAQADCSSTKVISAGGAKLDSAMRRSLRADLCFSDPAVRLVKTKLDAIIPEIEARFRTPLKGYQDPDFLVYRRGDYFGPHRDGQRDTGARSAVEERKITLVAYLGDMESDASDQALIFHDLIPRLPSGRVYPASLSPGAAIGFPSNVLHEVLPNPRERRCTIATWFI